MNDQKMDANQISFTCTVPDKDGNISSGFNAVALRGSPEFVIGNLRRAIEVVERAAATRVIASHPVN